jgi:hypothetical protein
LKTAGVLSLGMVDQRLLKSFLSMSSAASRESLATASGRTGSLPGPFFLDFSNSRTSSSPVAWMDSGCLWRSVSMAGCSLIFCPSNRHVPSPVNRPADLDLAELANGDLELVLDSLAEEIGAAWSQPPG